ncbi:putative Response regulator [Nitrospira sp. KM1]|uniref:response regulator n=1 Tax=Nitrospira sp. KM1 TaxID=1936990 RepID=UPI0013A73C18|nr:response regulator [Nitrospira sp. KM1]BCA53632.1 putative Response regulator [Nitrospira sp. KM1]
MPKVLVADDSIAVRKVAERLLTEAGLGVSLAANGEEALAFLSKECPDLIVSDVIMPDKSGYEVCAFVRAQSALAATPVLLISGIVNDEVAKQAESCRADGVLKKPFQGTSLKDRVLELLAKRQAHASPAQPVKSAEPVQPTQEAAQGIRISEEQLATYRQVSTQLKQAEDDLKRERDQTAMLSHKLTQLESQLGRIKELESLVAAGQEQASHANRASEELHEAKQRMQELEESAQEQASHANRASEELHEAKQRMQELKESAQEQALVAHKSQEELQLLRRQIQELEAERVAKQELAIQAKQTANDLMLAAGRVSELEVQLRAEQEQCGLVKQRVSQLQELADRVPELETALQQERHALAEQAEHLAEVQKMADRAREFEAALNAERQAAMQLVQQMNGLEEEVARGQEIARDYALEQKRSEELVQDLAREKQRMEEMAKRMAEIEGIAAKVKELEELLQMERDRNAVLTRHVSETEQSAQQATKRFEDMAKKLGEIAGLASQLGSGARRS